MTQPCMKFSFEVGPFKMIYALIVSLFILMEAFLYASISKNLKSTYFRNSGMKTINSSIKSSGKLGSPQILSILIKKIFLRMYVFFHMLNSIKNRQTLVT